jgi:eukaryotic-like serine/threonine-protein kinase
VQDFDVGQGTLPAGFQFGAYVIGSCIGQGGMARIYRAEHRVLRKPVALKVMESVLLERPDGRPRFLREGQAAAAVKHPNVVDITDVGVWHGRPYLVMELLEGEDLEQHLHRHRPLSEQDVARIMIPVIAGLVTAHAAGVVHRDLKPSNIFLSTGPDGEAVPKLLDFGISKLSNGLRTLDPSSTPIGELMGSPMYMSPEAVRGARDLTPQSDQYSLGVILYECVTGRPPFYGDSLLSVLEAVAHGKYESPRRFRPDLSTVFEVAISRAMSTEPSDRFPSMRELGRALCEAGDQRTRLLWTPSFGVRDVPFHRSTANLGSPIRTGSPLSTSVSRQARHAPLWPLGVAAVSLMLLAIGVVAYWRMPSNPFAAAAPPSETGRLAAPVAAASAVQSAPAPLAAAQEPRVSVETSSLREASNAAARPGGVERPALPVATSKAASDRSSAPRPHRPPEWPSEFAEARPPRPAASSRSASGSAAASGAAARAASPSPPPVEPAAPTEDDEIIFPVRAPTSSRPSPTLGANQSPILD